MSPITAEFARQLTPYLHAPRWLVAYSGGVDSSVLLHAAVQFSKHHSGPPVAALHIHHGLSPQADSWQDHCHTQCAALGVAFYTESVQVNNIGKGVEQAARTARYASFEKHLAAGDILLQGHHQNDQAETVLFRLFRSAGVKGLSGITPSRSVGESMLLRPFMNISRAEIEAYVAEHVLTAIHDDSNDSLHFDRNYIRHEILPAIVQRWPQAIKTISQSAEYTAEAAALMDDLAAIDLAAINEHDERLNLSQLAILSPRRQTNVLKFWLAQYAVRPSAAALGQIKQQFLCSDTGASPAIKIDGWQLNRYDSYLYCEPEYNLSVLVEQVWSGSESVALAEYICLSAEAIPCGGLRIDTEFRLSFDRASVRFHPKGRGHSNRLKKLMNECKILPWHRNAIPQLCIGDKPVAVPGVGISQEFTAKKGQQGYRICLTIGDHSYLCE